MLYWCAWVFWQHWTCQAPSDGPLPCEQYPMVCDQAPAELWDWWRLLFSLLWESVALECQVWHTLPSYCSDNIRSALSMTEKVSLLKDLRVWTSWIHWSLTQQRKKWLIDIKIQTKRQRVRESERWTTKLGFELQLSGEIAWWSAQTERRPCCQDASDDTVLFLVVSCCAEVWC